MMRDRLRRAASPISGAVNSLRGSPAAKAFIAMLLVAAAMRAVAFSCPAGPHPDTGSYVHLANQIRSLRFNGYNGGRSPVYPLFLVLTGSRFHFARLLQNLLGLAISSMLFVMVYRSTRSAGFALGAGVAYGVDLGPLSYEQFIMTETVCTFLLTLSALVLQRIVVEKKSGWHAYAVLGAISGLTALTRPMYAYLTPLYFAFLAMARPGVATGRPAECGKWLPTRYWFTDGDSTLLAGSRSLASFAAPAGLLIFGWCLFNWLHVGYFGLSTNLGFDLSNQSGAFIELASDRYANIRDPYLRKRAEKIAKGRTYLNTIWQVHGEICRETGYTKAQLSRELTRMSLELFAAHPMLYAKGVARAWERFWRPGLFTGTQFPGATLAGPFHAVRRVEFPTLRAVNLIFLLCAAYLALQFLLHRRPWGFDLCVTGTVLAASLIQAMVESGTSPRYAAPTLPLVFYTVAVSIRRCAIVLLPTRRSNQTPKRGDRDPRVT